VVLLALPQLSIAYCKLDKNEKGQNKQIRALNSGLLAYCWTNSSWFRNLW